MTTTKKAAALVERLEARQERYGKLHGNYLLYNSFDALIDREAAQEIRTLLAQVEELRRERDTWKEIAEKTAASGSSISRKLDTAKAQLAEAEAGIAEAVRLLTDLVPPPGFRETGRINVDGQIPVDMHLRTARAARAFVKKHKESRT